MKDIIKARILYELDQLFPLRKICLNDIKEVICNQIDLYDEYVSSLSKKQTYVMGRPQYAFESFNFFYKGAEVIYIFPWERSRTKNSIKFIDMKYGYCFNEFYEYVKFRYAKEEYRK